MEMREAKANTDQYPEKKYVWTQGSPKYWYNNKKENWDTRLKTSIVGKTGKALLVYMMVYTIIHFIYEYLLNSDQKVWFGMVKSGIRVGLNGYGRDLTFLLGFYVNFVIKRWWEQYKLIPWPDTMGLLNTALTFYQTDDAKKLSEDILRYQMLSFILCFRKISEEVRRAFPTSAELIQSGMATLAEIKNLEKKGDLDSVWWVPLHWCMHRLKMAKHDKIMPCDHKEAIGDINKYWEKLKNLENHIQAPIPAVYKQVAFLVVGFYFLAALIGFQCTTVDDFYLPIFLIFRFIFYFGWCKVAMALTDPFGDDKEDFEIGHLLSRHIWACNEHLRAGFEGLPMDEEVEQLPSLHEEPATTHPAAGQEGERQEQLDLRSFLRSRKLFQMPSLHNKQATTHPAAGQEGKRQEQLDHRSRSLLRSQKRKDLNVEVGVNAEVDVHVEGTIDHTQEISDCQC